MTKNIIDKLRQPEYTGENSCEAYTAANITVAGTLGRISVGSQSLLGQ